jgi:hypothetical protein|tara:strand:+ start:40 stop:273 length:234 start_codon:yes stop_codon:yes gene_type:complete
MKLKIDDIKSVNTLGTMHDNQMLNVILNSLDGKYDKVMDCGVRVNVLTLLDISKENRKNIRLVLNKKVKYYHIEREV